MSHQNKKSKMLNFFGFQSTTSFSTSTTDPFNPEVFPEEIREEILSYLPVPDLLNSTLVSKLWNDSIGASLIFKKNIAVKLHSWNQESPTAIINSSRLYSIISISDFELSSRRLQFLNGKSWHDATFSFARVSSQRKLVELLSSFATVRDLRILSTNISKLDKSKPISLPELKSLVLSDVTLDLFDILIAKHPALKKLSMRFVICDIQSPRTVGDALVEFLILNETLKDLELNFIVTNAIFKEDFAGKINSKLTGLTVGLNDTTDGVRGNIEGFLKSQSATLEHLKLIFHQKFVRKEANEWGYWDRDRLWNLEGHESNPTKPANDVFIIYNVWNSMTELKLLELRFLQETSELEENRELLKTLKQNLNLKSLFIQFMNVNAPQSLVTNLMKLSPNLETIYVTKLTPGIVRLAATNLKALRNLKCFEFYGDCLQEYNQLKTTKENVNKFIAIVDRCAFG